MSFKKLLTDRCDIYHLQETTDSPGYGLPGEIRYEYNNDPDLTNVPCYFNEKSQSITQGDPGAEIVHSFKVSFAVNADVRLNDKVIFDGIEYTAQIPKKIKNHHIEVTVTRKGSL